MTGLRPYGVGVDQVAAMMREHGEAFIEAAGVGQLYRYRLCQRARQGGKSTAWRVAAVRAAWAAEQAPAPAHGRWVFSYAPDKLVTLPQKMPPIPPMRFEFEARERPSWFTTLGYLSELRLAPRAQMPFVRIADVC